MWEGGAKDEQNSENQPIMNSTFANDTGHE